MVDRLVNSELNARRISNVEQCFGSSGQPLTLPGRVLVGEGVLTKVCRKKAKPRQFFLFNDVLVYGNIIIHKKKYNKQHILPLEDVKLENVSDEGNLRNGWKIINPRKSFVVYAATATEKKEWMAHIRKCVNDLLTRRGIQQSTTTDSPVWIPDSEAKTCMHCRKSEFTVVNRRHHCRHCGIVACNPCTSKRWLFPQQSSKPIRVCLTCYQKLSLEAASNSLPRKYDVIATGSNRSSSGEDSSDDDDDQARDGMPSGDQAEELDIHDAVTSTIQPVPRMSHMAVEHGLDQFVLPHPDTSFSSFWGEMVTFAAHCKKMEALRTLLRDALRSWLEHQNSYNDDSLQMVCHSRNGTEYIWSEGHKCFKT